MHINSKVIIANGKLWTVHWSLEDVAIVSVCSVSSCHSRRTRWWCTPWGALYLWNCRQHTWCSSNIALHSQQTMTKQFKDLLWIDCRSKATYSMLLMLQFWVRSWEPIQTTQCVWQGTEQIVQTDSRTDSLVCQLVWSSLRTELTQKNKSFANGHRSLPRKKSRWRVWNKLKHF